MDMGTVVYPTLIKHQAAAERLGVRAKTTAIRALSLWLLQAAAAATRPRHGRTVDGALRLCLSPGNAVTGY